MRHKIPQNLFSLTCALLLLSACSGGIREQLGLDREAPDEFLVRKHAPLEMPPTIALPPPQRGAHRPQEKTVETRAKEAVFGNEAQTNSTQSQSSAETTLLQKTGANQTDSSIRERVNYESDNLEDKNQSVVKKLLKIGDKKKQAPATVIDAQKEYERIKQKSEQGQTITGEGVPEKTE